MPQKILITGGAGFIGYFLAKDLLEKGHQVIIYDAFLNYISPLKSHYPYYLEYRLRDLQDKAMVIRGDIRHRGQLIKALKEQKPEIIIHLAAIPVATISDQYSEEATQINLLGTATVLETIRAVDFVKRFVYASSSFTYGNFIHDPADENHPTDPVDIYGATKLAGEILTRGFGKRFGIEYVIVRPSAVYGPTDANRRVTQIFVEKALEGESLILENGGKDKVDFTYVTDAAQGFALAALHPQAKNETFNITRGEGRSAEDLAGVLKSLIPGTKTIIEPSEKIRPKRGTLDISKAKKILGYEPRYSLEEGMKKYIEFIKSTGLFKK